MYQRIYCEKHNSEPQGKHRGIFVVYNFQNQTPQGQVWAGPFINHVT